MAVVFLGFGASIQVTVQHAWSRIIQTTTGSSQLQVHADHTGPSILDDKMWTFLLAAVLYLGHHLHYISLADTRTVSQCFATKGNPFVTLYCGQHQMIKVTGAFHGRHFQNDTDCEKLEDDCTQDQLNTFYNWPECMGHQHCVKSVKQSWMPSCGNYSQYLQVDYTCVPGSEVINLCSSGIYEVMDGYIQSPYYPDHYPRSQDCECKLKAEGGRTNMFVSFFDLALEMRGRDECVDWLLIETGEEKEEDRHLDLNCGMILQGTKNMTIKGSQLVFHFHSDRHDNRSQAFQFNSFQNLKGFWLYFKAEPESNITLDCHPTKPKRLNTLHPNPTVKTGPGLNNIDLTSGSESDQKDNTGKKAAVSIATVLVILAQFLR